MAKKKTKICEYELPEERGLTKKCKHKVEDAEKYCIFHREEKDEEEFRKAIEKYIEDTTRKYTKATEIEKESIYLDFMGFRFPGCTPYFKKNIFFLDCLFTYAVFNGLACFANSNFKKKVFFEHTRFLDKADFNNAKFEAFTKFSNCIFGGPAVFMAAVFSGRTYFVGSEFRKPSEFTIARIEKEMHFVQSRTKEMYFWAVTVTRNALVYFNKIDLSKWAFAFTIGVENFFFTECTWRRRIGPARFFTLDEILSKKGAIKYEAVIEVYRKLRANFEKNHVYGVASDFHIGEMEMLRKTYSPVIWFSTYLREFEEKNTFVRIAGAFQILLFYLTTKTENIVMKPFKGKLKKASEKLVSNINIYSFIFVFINILIATMKRKKPLSFKAKWWIAAKFYITAKKSRLSRVKTFRWLLLGLYKSLSNYGESTGRPLFYLATTLLVFAGLFTLVGFDGPEGRVVWRFVGLSRDYCPDLSTFWGFAKDFLYATALSFQNLFHFKSPVYPLISLGQLVASLQKIVAYTLGTLFILSLRRAFKR